MCLLFGTVLSVVSFGEVSSRVDRGPKRAASYFEWAPLDGRPDSSDKGLHLSGSGDGPYRFEPSQVFSACTAVPLGDARDEKRSTAGR